MFNSAAAVPKAELHVHLEGTAPPTLIRRLAARHNAAPPEDRLGPDRFRWQGFADFLDAYDEAAAMIRTAADYRDVTLDYLLACAEEGAVYVELMSSPDHAALAGLSFADHLAGIVDGIEAARDMAAIEARLIVTCVRHFGVDRAEAVARACVRHRHPLLTGFGMGGDETFLTAAAFAGAFRIATGEAGLGATVHAGEVVGSESVRDAVDALPVSRIGHGVRVLEDPALTEELVARGIVLEVCPTSNVATGVVADYDAHPLKRLVEAGLKVTLNSDDPPYFATSIGREYALAMDRFGLDAAALGSITCTALEAAFVDEATRTRLLARVGP